MLRAFLSAIGLMLIAFISMTTAAESSSPAASGIEGTIVVSPARPGPITRDGPSVAPVRNTQFLVNTGDATVARFTTDDEGRFRVALPPGRYVVVREGTAPRIGRWRFEADVVAGEITKVNWTAD